jgi:GTP-binding protein HflX
VEAFRSTLEEVAESDLVLHVVDGSHADPEGQLAAVREVLADVDAADVPEVVVINKIDAADAATIARLLRAEPHAVTVSARTGEGIDKLRATIESELPSPPVEISALVPYDRGELVSRAHRDGEVLAIDHEPEGTSVHARVPADLAAALEPYVITPSR